MAVTPLTLVRLVGPVVLGTTDTAVYTVPTGKTVRVDAVRFSNTTGAAVTVNWSIVPSGGTVGDGTHKMLSGASCAANDIIDDEPKQVLTAGDKIAAFASATGVVLTVSGIVVG